MLWLLLPAATVATATETTAAALKMMKTMMLLLLPKDDGALVGDDDDVDVSTLAICAQAGKHFKVQSTRAGSSDFICLNDLAVKKLSFKGSGLGSGASSDQCEIGSQLLAVYLSR